MDITAQSYESAWNPLDYLRQYYAGPDVSGDEFANARFVSRMLGAMDRRWDRALEFGCGPTIHHAASLAPYVEQIDMADYLPANLEQVSTWRDNLPQAHDWDCYLGNVIAAEGKLDTDALAARKALLRDRIGMLRTADIRKENPLGTDDRYPLVASYYCAEAVAGSRDEWKCFLTNVASLVAPGGVLILGAMRRCNEYHVFGNAFISAHVDEHDFAELLPTLGFPAKHTVTEVASEAGWEHQGFGSICCVCAVKKG